MNAAAARSWITIRFAVIGIASTLLYFVLAMVLTAGVPPLAAPATGSFVAYFAAVLFSYTGHKFFTFMSAGDHRFEAPRFAAVSALGFMIAILLPILADKLNAAPIVAIVLTCCIIPAANYIALRFWVFAQERRSAPSKA